MILMNLTMTKYHENLLRDSPLSLLSTVKIFSSLESKMILRIPNETFSRITRYIPRHLPWYRWALWRGLLFVLRLAPPRELHPDRFATWRLWRERTSFSDPRQRQTRSEGWRRDWRHPRHRRHQRRREYDGKCFLRGKKKTRIKKYDARAYINVKRI